jgi:hypothetical protein
MAPSSRTLLLQTGAHILASVVGLRDSCSISGFCSGRNSMLNKIVVGLRATPNEAHYFYTRD